MLHRKTRPFPAKNRKGQLTGKMTNPKNYFICRTYINAQRHRGKSCSTHHADTEALTLLVLETLRDVSHQAQSNRKGFLRQFRQSTDDSAEMKKALAEKQERQEKLDELIMEAYEANFKGQLTDEQLQAVVSEYEAEQEKLGAEINALEGQLSDQPEQKQDGQKFVNTLKKFPDFTELTSEMVNELIDKIVVHERTGKRNNYQQEIDIYFKFVGKIRLNGEEGEKKE